MAQVSVKSLKSMKISYRKVVMCDLIIIIITIIIIIHDLIIVSWCF